MIESIRAGRKGWIKTLTMIEKMVGLACKIYNHPNHFRQFTAMNCEDDRAKKIEKKFVELEELIWEATAVSEKVLSESVNLNPDVCEDPEFFEHDPFDKNLHCAREQFYKAAKDLSELARSIYDENSDGSVEQQVVYPGGVAGPVVAVEDPRQLKLGLVPAVPVNAEPSDFVDFKKRQANDGDNQMEVVE